MRRLLASGAFALALLALAACAEEQPPDLDETWTVRGVYNGPRFEGDAASVEHEAIPDLMDAMTMDFRLARPDEIDGLTEGDKVTFRLALVDGLLEASDFTVLPDTTTLDLTPAEMAPSRADLDAPEASGDGETERDETDDAPTD